MASRLTTPASSPARQKHSPKKSKKKTKEKNSPNGEATPMAMGCSPSQAVIVQSTKTENAHLHPTIFMVGDKSFQMLRELGELKFYHLAQYNEAEDTAETLHQDFAAQLENPIQYLQGEQSKGSSHYHVAERSACKINADYLFHVQRHDPSAGLSKDGLTKQESGACFSNSSCSADSPNHWNVQTTAKTSSSSTILLSSAASPSHSKDIKITAENTSDSPILLSSTSASHSKLKDYIKITAKNESHSPTPDRTKIPLSQNNQHGELSPKYDSTTSRTNCAPDPFDEIFSAPNTSCTTSALPNEGNITPKLKTRTLFGRNRITPKRDASDKYDTMKSEHESLRSTIDDS